MHHIADYPKAKIVTFQSLFTVGLAHEAAWYTKFVLYPRMPYSQIEERKKTGPHLTKNEHLGFNGRLAVFITNAFGSMGAFYVLVLWMFGWMILAVLGIGFFRLDPYPFTFLLFLSNLVQLFALPILAVGQQVLSRASDKQAEQTYKDAEAILKIQDEVHQLIKVNNELTQEIHTIMVGKTK